MSYFFTLTVVVKFQFLKVMEGVSIGQHPTPPEGCPGVIKSLMLSCWERCPRDRTIFSKIVENLSEDNIKVSMGHSNLSYGTSNSSKPKSLCISKDDDIKPSNLCMNVKEKTAEISPSWPKLCNFSNVNSNISMDPLHAESPQDTKSIPSISSETQYTVLLPDEKEEIDIES